MVETVKLHQVTWEAPAHTASLVDTSMPGATLKLFLAVWYKMH